MFYHLISDDAFFLTGAVELLRSMFNKDCIVDNNININGWKKTKEYISKTPFQKIIVYMHCYRKRRRLLRLAAAHNIEVIILTEFKDLHYDIEYNPTIISSLSSKDEFLFSLLNNRFSTKNKGSALSYNVIKRLSTGISITELAKKLGISQKAVYATKNNTIRNLGLTPTSLHGLLLCRDILEMKSINLHCKKMRG